VEHVLATQMIALRPWRYMQVEFAGVLPEGVTSKDLMLAMIARLGPNGGQGYIIEYTGDVVRGLSVEARMTLCNMTIEAGARAGLVAPDAVTFAYLSGRPYSPAGAHWERAGQHWSSLRSDPGAEYDRTVRIDCSGLSPYATWGTSPAQAIGLHDPVPDPATLADAGARAAAERALEYMAVTPGTRLTQLAVDAVFVGSCTNARIEDLRSVASVLSSRRVAPGVRMLIVPGSMQVKRQAEEEGLAEIFSAAGAEWRNSGCSMCLGMNPDRLPSGARCAATSNRNFQGRQGPGVRTHLVSPAVAAATAVAGRFASPADL
jgi:3-isopropylmalate/(R)-2-methylmalate dehydratase large subunit